MKDRWTVLIFGICLAAVAFILRLLNYHYIMADIGMEAYLALTGAVFLVLGLWLGASFLIKRGALATRAAPPVTIAAEALQANNPGTGLTNREMEILQLIAQGFSNQEIADKLFISLNTVKTHSSNLFIKLEVKRRTQAVIKAKELKIIT